MAESYVGEIRMFAGNFAPDGWQFCQGQLFQISEFDVLYNLIGVTYGGDGVSTFAIPNLQSRLAIHQGQDGQGNNYSAGQTGGAEQVSLNTQQIPVHSHPMTANNTAASGTLNTGSGNIFGAPNTGDQVYGPGTSTTPLSPKGVGNSPGSGSAHSNIKPFQCINFIISMYGIYPSPN